MRFTSTAPRSKSLLERQHLNHRKLSSRWPCAELLLLAWAAADLQCRFIGPRLPAPAPPKFGWHVRGCLMPRVAMAESRAMWEAEIEERGPRRSKLCSCCCLWELRSTSVGQNVNAYPCSAAPGGKGVSLHGRALHQMGWCEYVGFSFAGLCGQWQGRHSALVRVWGEPGCMGDGTLCAVLESSNVWIRES